MIGSRMGHRWYGGPLALRFDLTVLASRLLRTVPSATVTLREDSVEKMLLPLTPRLHTNVRSRL